MLNSYAPGSARRTLVAVLAFLLAAAFAVAASMASAQAADAKEFNVYFEVVGDADVTVTQSPPDVHLEFFFENPDNATNTQQAGSFQVVFPDGFELKSAGTPSIAGWVASVNQSTDTLDLYADTAGNRLGIDQSISVELTFAANTLGVFDKTDFSYSGDQQVGGVGGGVGNTFELANSPTITVVCGAGEQCSVTAKGNNNDSGTAACDPNDGCGKEGLLFIEFLGTSDCGGVQCELWNADSQTGGDDFYLIIDTGGVSNVKIYAEQFDADGNDLFYIGRAQNCKPPVRNFGCVDTSHPDYNRKAGIFPIRFPAGIDPPGGYR